MPESEKTLEAVISSLPLKKRRHTSDIPPTELADVADPTSHKNTAFTNYVERIFQTIKLEETVQHPRIHQERIVTSTTEPGKVFKKVSQIQCTVKSGA